MLALGFMIGLIYRHFATRSRYKVFGYGMVLACTAMVYNSVSMDITKLLGAMLMSTIILGLTMRLFEPLIMRAIQGVRSRRAASSPAMEG